MTRPRAWQWLVVVGTGLLVGCGQPQIAFDEATESLVMRMHTAVMAKRVDLVDQVLADAQKLTATNQLSAEAMAVFDEVAEQGRQDQWSEAQRRWLRFAKAQRPTR